MKPQTNHKVQDWYNAFHRLTNRDLAEQYRLYTTDEDIDGDWNERAGFVYKADILLREIAERFFKAHVR